MKVELLCLDSAIKGVAEIRIVYTLQGIKLDNTTLESHEDTMGGHNSWWLSKSQARPTLP
jgi:hypothetical protein